MIFQLQKDRLSILLLSIATFAFLLTSETSAQSLAGAPEVQSFTLRDFQTNPQFWDGDEGIDGTLYFGNNTGLMIFDGIRWKLATLPNHSSVRSVAVSKNGKVYVGGFNEIGYFERDRAGEYHFTSLVHHIREEERNFENAWEIHILKDLVIFRTFDRLIIHSPLQTYTVTSVNKFIKSAVVDNKFYVHDRNVGLFTLEIPERSLKGLLNDTVLRNEEITVMASSGPSKLILISKNGKVFRTGVQGNLISTSELILSNRGELVANGLMTDSKEILIGTLSDGIKKLTPEDDYGSIKESGIPTDNPTILDLLLTAQGNVWALLNNGLNKVKTNSPHKYLLKNVSVYDVLSTEDRMYVATNEGVYYTEFNGRAPFLTNQSFSKIRGSEGQAWSLTKIGEDIYCGHDRGGLIINKDQASRIPGPEGVWKLDSLRVNGKFHLVAFTYDGIYKGNKTGLNIKIDGFDESARDYLIDPATQDLWVCHGYKGVFRLKLTQGFERVVSVEHFTENHGLPSRYENNIALWGEDIVFTTEKGLYEFNNETSTFKPIKEASRLFGNDQNIRQIFDHNDTTWLIHHDELAFIDHSSTNPELIKSPFKHFKGAFNRSMEYFQPLNGHQILLGTIDGLVLYDARPKQELNAATAIQSFLLQNETGIFKSVEFKGTAPRLPPTPGPVRIEFASPQLADLGDIEFSWRLKGLEENFSPWTATALQTYSFLPPGDYSFEVRSRNNLGQMALSETLDFTVLPLWYQTSLFKRVLIVIALLLPFLGYFLIQKIIKQVTERTKMQEEKTRKLLELELKEIKLNQENTQIKLLQRKLEEDILEKRKELSNYTLILSEKRSVMTDIKADILEIKELTKTAKGREMVYDLMGKIQKNLDNEDYLKVFEVNFEKIHVRFFQQLQEYILDITKRELHLAAFVKMDFTNKEIAPLLNISVRGVETARYRLRKKLQLDQDENLVEFLCQIGEAKGVL